MREFPGPHRLTVVTGHYGCGKTNFSLNLAIDLAKRHGSATIVDLDVVNPYFRSSDYASSLAAHGVTVISPNFAGTTLDTPSLSPRIYSVFEGGEPVVFDVGGDDAGATALGRFQAQIEASGYQMLYLVNRYRNLTGTPQEVAGLLCEIEGASRLKATGVVNNSHLRDETTLQTVLDSLDYARDAAELMDLPLTATTVPRAVWDQAGDNPNMRERIENPYPVEVYVRTPWEDASEEASE